MPRSKEYIEDEVADKAMHLFWDKGFKSTSTRMLEEATGINKFSIYSSFGSKKGLFLAGLKRYVEQAAPIIQKLKNSSNGKAGIKTYFYDFLAFSEQNKCNNGCFMNNTILEFGKTPDPEINAEVRQYHANLKALFVNNLRQEPKLAPNQIEQQADALIIALVGLASASKFFNTTELHHFIEETFK